MRIVTQSLGLATDARLELYNLTDRVAEIVARHGIRDGLVLVTSLHTTFALLVNEWQDALLHDIKEHLGRIVSPDASYRHNDPRFSDCDRRNAHAHLQATLLGHALTFPLAGGRLVLGEFQAIIAAELDGPRNRELSVQIVGR